MKKNIKNRGGLNQQHANPASPVHKLHASMQWEYKTDYVSVAAFSKRCATVLRLSGAADLPTQAQGRSWMDRHDEDDIFPPSVYLIEAPSDFTSVGDYTNLTGCWHVGLDKVNEVYDRWQDSWADVHSGYMSRRAGEKGDLLPRFYDQEPCSDSFLYLTTCFAPWDSGAVRDSLRNGTVKPRHVLGLLERLRRRIADPVFTRIVSGGAKKGLFLIGILVHVLGGVIHLHLVYIKSAPLLFMKRDGVLVGRSGAPGGGRRAAGEKWIGGERLGLIGMTHKHIIPSAGPAITGAVALRAAGLPPPIEFGGSWGRLDFILGQRVGINTAKDEYDSRELEDKVAAHCFDINAQRLFAREMDHFCFKHPSVSGVRQVLKDAHHHWRGEMDRKIVEFFLGDRLRKLEVEEAEARKKRERHEADILKLQEEKELLASEQIRAREMFADAERKASDAHDIRRQVELKEQALVCKRAEIDAQEKNILEQMGRFEEERTRVHQMHEDAERMASQANQIKALIESEKQFLARQREDLDAKTKRFSDDKNRHEERFAEMRDSIRLNYETLLMVKSSSDYVSGVFNRAAMALQKEAGAMKRDWVFYTEDFRLYVQRVVANVKTSQAHLNTAVFKIVADVLEIHVPTRAMKDPEHRLKE